MGFQIFLSIFVFIAILRLFVQFKKKNITPFFFLFFLFIWAFVLYFAWNTTLLDKIGGLLGLERGADILVYLALFLLYYYVFVSIIRFYKLEGEINKLTRKDAINDFLKRYNIEEEDYISEEEK